MCKKMLFKWGILEKTCFGYCTNRFAVSCEFTMCFSGKRAREQKSLSVTEFWYHRSGGSFLISLCHSIKKKTHNISLTGGSPLPVSKMLDCIARSKERAAQVRKLVESTFKSCKTWAMQVCGTSNHGCQAHTPPATRVKIAQGDGHFLTSLLKASRLWIARHFSLGTGMKATSHQSAWEVTAPSFAEDN